MGPVDYWPGSGTEVGDQQVVICLPPHHKPGVAICDEDDSRAEHLVVIGAHRVAVSPGDGGGHDIPHSDVRRQPAVSNEHVTGFTVLSDQPDCSGSRG